MQRDKKVHLISILPQLKPKIDVTRFLLFFNFSNKMYCRLVFRVDIGEWTNTFGRVQTWLAMIPILTVGTLTINKKVIELDFVDRLEVSVLTDFMYKTVCGVYIYEPALMLSRHTINSCLFVDFAYLIA